MPRLGIGMPLVSTATEASVLAVQDFFWLNDVSGELTPIHTASRTNLVPDTSASGMTGSGTTISSSIGPDGTNNGIKMTATTATSQHHKGFGAIPVVDGLTYAISYYIKKGTINSVAIYTNTAQINSNATINFANETITVAGVGIISNSDFILDEGNGWYRVGYSVVAAATGNTVIYTTVKDLSTYEGSTDDYTEYYGPQVIQDSRASALIPTSGTAVTVTTPLNDTHNAWDYDSTNLTLKEDPDSEGGWQRPSNLVLNHNFADYGDVVIDGSNANGGTNWNANSNWVKTVAGKFTCDGTNSNDINQDPPSAVIGQSYVLSFEILSIDSGNLVMNFGGIVGTNRTTVGVHSQTITATGTDRVRVRPNTAGTIASEFWRYCRY